MQSHAPALAQQVKTWKFLELWVDPVLFPPKILMLVGDQARSLGGRTDKSSLNYLN
jgi:hypothetical protein